MKLVTNTTTANISGLMFRGQVLSIPAGESSTMSPEAAEFVKKTYSWVSISDAPIVDIKEVKEEKEDKEVNDTPELPKKKTIIALRKEYKEKTGSDVPNNKKNDKEWIEAKINA